MPPRKSLEAMLRRGIKDPSSIYLDKCDFTPDSLQRLLKRIANKVEALSIVDCRGLDSSYSVLFQYLPTMVSLTYLEIEPIGKMRDSTMIELADKLPKHLSTLHIRNCSPDATTGPVAILSAASARPSLDSFWLSTPGNSHFHPSVVLRLADVIRQTPTIKYCSINNPDYFVVRGRVGSTDSSSESAGSDSDESGSGTVSGSTASSNSVGLGLAPARRIATNTEYSAAYRQLSAALRRRG